MSLLLKDNQSERFIYWFSFIYSMSLSSIKKFGKIALVTGGLVAVLSGCYEQASVSKEHYVDLNNDSKKEIVYAKYAGGFLTDNVWDVYSVKNDNGKFGAPTKIARINR